MRGGTGVQIRLAIAIAAVVALFPPAMAQQRTVNFYNWSNYVAPGVLEDFTRETGIKVVYDTFDANETLETRLLAGKSGYDVVVPTAYFLQRQIAANIFQKLDKSKLPNLANAWPVVTKQLAVYDPGNQYAANYMWGTTGIGYNVKMAQKILGAAARIDGWDIVFKPENLAKFRDCGIHMLDSADDIFPAALSYLGLDPNSTKQADLEKAADLVAKIRPYVRKFHSSEYLSALATGRGSEKQHRDRLRDSERGRADVFRQSRDSGRREEPRRGLRVDQLSLPARGGREEHRFPVLRQWQSCEPETG
jgi:putrescine transport system substrate-binding protein